MRQLSSRAALSHFTVHSDLLAASDDDVVWSAGRHETRNEIANTSTIWSERPAVCRSPRWTRGRPGRMGGQYDYGWLIVVAGRANIATWPYCIVTSTAAAQLYRTTRWDETSTRPAEIAQLGPTLIRFLCILLALLLPEKCSIVYLHLCQEYLNSATFTTPVSLQIQNRTRIFYRVED